MKEIKSTISNHCKRIEYAILFDLDGVIVDSNKYHKNAIKSLFRNYGVQITNKEIIDRIYGRPNRDWIKDFFGDNIKLKDIKRVSDEKEKLFRDLYSHNVKPIKGLKDFLNLLTINNILMVVASSAPKSNVNLILDKTGFKKYFSAVLDESSSILGKPNPDIYIKAAYFLGIDPNRCIVIEDSISGVHAAKAAGCKVIGITTTIAENEFNNVDLIIHDFTELTIEILNNIVKLPAPRVNMFYHNL